jgi:hypothetical protein
MKSYSRDERCKMGEEAIALLERAQAMRNEMHEATGMPATEMVDLGAEGGLLFWGASEGDAA